MGLLDELHEAHEVIQARELAAFARSQYSMPKSQQPQWKELAMKPYELPATQQWQNMELSSTARRPWQQDSDPSLLPQNDPPILVDSDYRSPDSFLATMWSGEEEPASTNSPLPVSSTSPAPVSRRKCPTGAPPLSRIPELPNRQLW